MVFGFSYVAGAPRHKIRGAVFQLQKEDRKATFVRRLEGEQVPPGGVTFLSVEAPSRSPGEMSGCAHPGRGSGLSTI